MLPNCERCGRTGPRMHGLMTRWFGSHVELRAPAAASYFHLCPRCFRRDIAPDLDAIVAEITHHHLSSTDDAGAPGGAPRPRTPPRLRLIRAG